MAKPANNNTDSMSGNPWKGLNFYKEGEILYGRDDEIQSLALYITNNTQTVLYGKSGIGKSSIINAGVFPIARKEGLYPIPIRLKHDSETSYISQIIAAFKESGIGIHEILKPIDKNNETLWEYLHRNSFYNAEKNIPVRPLIVLDQFEEIFTLQHDEKKKIKFFSELADLLNEVKPEYIATLSSLQTESPKADTQLSADGFSFDFGISDGHESDNRVDYISNSFFNIVFTIREDFLSYLERYTRYIPVMKSNRYALLPINEEQAKDIIMKPVSGLVDIDVAKLIIEKVTGRTDFTLGDTPEIEVDAAVLSLFLSRIYIKRDDATAAITADLVNVSSKDIIKDFYEESVADLPQDEIEKLEDLLLTHDNRRNNSSRNDLISEGISERVIKTLVEERKLLRQFSYQDDIRVEFMHDILCPVVNDRIEHREEIAREKELLKRQEEERLKLEKERKEQAEKLAQAEEERKKLEEKARLARIRNRQRIRNILLAAFGVVLFAFGMWLFFDYFPNKRLYEEFYSEYENIHGWPQGIGEPLSKEDRIHTALYYRLSHIGNKNGNLHTDVEIMSSNLFLPNACRIPSIEWSENDNTEINGEERKLNSILANVKRIHFSSNVGSNEINKEEYLDENGNLLMYINYFHDAANSAWAQYYTSSGQSMVIRTTGIDRKKISWDEAGHIQSVMFYDKDGVRRSIIDGQKVDGYLWNRQNGDTVWRYSLNEFGLPSSGLSYNTVATISKNNREETIYINSKIVNDPYWKEVLSENGYSRVVCHGDSIQLFKPQTTSPFAYRIVNRDNAGNIIKIMTNGSLPEGMPSTICYEYQNGLLAKEEWLDAHGQGFIGADSLHTCRWEYAYNNIGLLTESSRSSAEGEVLYLDRQTKEVIGNKTVLTKEILDPQKSPRYVKQIDTVIINESFTTTVTVFLDQNQLPQNCEYNVGGRKLNVHKIVAKKENNILTQEFYVYQGSQVKPVQVNVDSNGIAQAFFKRIEEYDDHGNTIGMTIEDGEGAIIKNMMYFFQNDQLIGRSVRGIEGTPVRCNRWEEEGFAYYKLYYSKDFDGNFAWVASVDEWENHSVIRDNPDYLSINRKSYYGMVFRVEGATLPNIFSKNFEQVAFETPTGITAIQIPYVHVLSEKSIMYADKTGIRDGDRIMKFGGWKFGMSKEILAREWDRAMRGRKPVEVSVLRPSLHTFQELSFTFSLSNKEKSLIEYHLLRLTEEENDFLNDFLKNN